MANLILICNNTLSDNLSASNLNCFETENISLNLADETTQQFIYASQNVIALLGMVTNLVVVIVFLNHNEFRQKIPNIFIIHQVSKNCLIFVNTLLITKTYTCLLVTSKLHTLFSRLVVFLCWTHMVITVKFKYVKGPGARQMLMSFRPLIEYQ